MEKIYTFMLEGSGHVKKSDLENFDDKEIEQAIQNMLKEKFKIDSIMVITCVEEKWSS